jgi:hypothetical protein
MTYEKELEILKAMQDSPSLKIHPDIWTKYKYGGEVLLWGVKPAYKWIPIEEKQR